MKSAKLSNATPIIVGLSGGVDSSVTALLLQQQGYDVTAAFMKNWEQDDSNGPCPAELDLADAKSVCTRLQLPLKTVNFSEEYWQRVFQYFLAEYQSGRTPNPDVLCNQEIKFKAFLDFALNQGAKKIATGHYARIEQNGDHYYLLKGLDQHKDQSYFLHRLNQKQLAHSLFPLGELQKTQVRRLALQHQLITHNKKDSTGICFIGERRFKNFLSEYLLAEPGIMQTPEGETIGEHDGLMFYTIGQRQGLNIGGRKNAKQQPWYVLEKDIKTNRLIVGQGHDHPLLLCKKLIAHDVHWINPMTINLTYRCQAKIRYGQTDQACTLTVQDNNKIQVAFNSAQRAATPGQSVVFYDGERCLGGGIIDRTIR